MNLSRVLLLLGSLVYGGREMSLRVRRACVVIVHAFTRILANSLLCSILRLLVFNGQINSNHDVETDGCTINVQRKLITRIKIKMAEYSNSACA